MGCTSSAPSTLDPKTSSATDRKLEMESSGIEDDNRQLKRADEELKSSAEIAERVLPASDIVETNLDLDNYNESAATNEQDKHTYAECITVEHVIESTLIKDINATPPVVVKEEIIMDSPPPNEPGEGVVIEDLEQTEDDPGDNELIVDTGQIIQDEMLSSIADVGQKNEAEDSPNDAFINHRATRWEALADVVAELPPKLTVDPITGQIYTVTKRDC